MSDEELEKEAEEYADKSKPYFVVNEYGSTVFTQLDIEQAYLAGAEPREKRIAELEAQIEKMQNCKNCANYMISGKCPSFFRTGWCKNWEMTRSKK